MWKLILGTLGLLCGLPLGCLVGYVSFFVIAAHYRINWYHGDDRLSWLVPLFLVLGPVFGSVCGALVGARLDRARARRYAGEDSPAPETDPRFLTDENGEPE